MAKLQIGSLFVTNKEGRKFVSIGLGKKSKNGSNWDNSVELVVKDNNGKVIHTQKDGFVELVNPRTQPDELLKAGLIDEAAAAKMRERVKGIPEKIQYQLMVKS